MRTSFVASLLNNVAQAPSEVMAENRGIQTEEVITFFTHQLQFLDQILGQVALHQTNRDLLVEDVEGIRAQRDLLEFYIGLSSGSLRTITPTTASDESNIA